MNRNRLVCVVFVLLFILSACNDSPPASSSKHVAASPQPRVITTGNAYQTVPASFLGFSVELSDLCTVLQRDAANGLAYEHLYTSIGRGILRIGGNTADASMWSVSRAYVCSNRQSVATPTLAAMLFAFAARIHWRVIWTLPLLNYNPGSAAQEAAKITQLGGASLLGFAIGNEPELYGKNTASLSTTWNASSYLDKWETEYQAVKSAVPDSTISGPDTSSIDTFFSAFVQQAGTTHQVSPLTSHYYTRNAARQPSATIAELLSPDTFNGFKGDVVRWVQAAQSVGLPFALTEVNSISDSGVSGVSDTAAATFWLASVLFYAASQSVAFVDLQEARSATYNVIEDDGQPSVLYRALELVHQVISGARLVTVSGVPSSSLQVMATQLKDGTMRVVLVNHDPLNTQLVPVAVPKGTKAESLTTLVAPALNTTSNVRLQTQAWSDSAPVQLAPDTVVVLTFRPA